MKAWMAGAALGVGLFCFGCATHRQTVAELEAALVSLVPPEQSAEWLGSLRTTPPATRPLAPPKAIVIAWVPARPGEGREPQRIPRAAREGWMASIREKLERGGLAPRVDVTSPDVFDKGVSLSGARALATQHEADLVVLFAVEINRRRYDAFTPGTPATGGVSGVQNIVEVVSIARAIGVAPGGQPLFSGAKRGFDSEAAHMRSVDEVEEVSTRVALEEIGDLIALHVDQIFYGRSGRTR